MRHGKKYLAAKSDVVVTVEGGMMHLAYGLGKPFVLLQMPGSGPHDAWLTPAISHQVVHFLNDRRSVGELTLQTYERTQGPLRALSTPPESESAEALLEAAA